MALPIDRMGWGFWRNRGEESQMDQGEERTGMASVTSVREAGSSLCRLTNGDARVSDKQAYN
jgi:hypothetical protein